MADNILQSPDTVRQMSGGREGGGFILSPDPSALTASAVTIAKDDLRRELAAQRELLTERIERTERLVTDTYVRLGDEIQANIRALDSLLTQRISGLESVLELLETAMADIPAGRDQLRERLQNDIKIAIENLRLIHEEKFTAISQQFEERDTRSEQEKKASKEALDAALLAQKESVSQQNDANTTAATKSETSFTKQIDQIATLIATLEKALTDRITELKERIDRGEGQGTGTDKALANSVDTNTLRLMQDAIKQSQSAAEQSKRTALIGQIIAAFAVLMVVISIGVTIVLHTHP